MKNRITKNFVDETGNNASMIITSNTDQKVSLRANYKLQRPESDNKYMKKGAKAKGIFTSEIGIKSEGFAPIFTLALILTLAATLIAILMWRL